MNPLPCIDDGASVHCVDDEFAAPISAIARTAPRTITVFDRFERSVAGKQEILEPSRAMTRAARNLLLVIDSSFTGQEWTEKIRDCTKADLRHLIEQELIELFDEVEESGVSPRAEAAIARATHKALSAVLTRQARIRFGLLKGYRTILGVESATEMSQLRRLAFRFVRQIGKAHGELAVEQFCKELESSR